MFSQNRSACSALHSRESLLYDRLDQDVDVHVGIQGRALSKEYKLNKVRYIGKKVLF